MSTHVADAKHGGGGAVSATALLRMRVQGGDVQDEDGSLRESEQFFSPLATSRASREIVIDIRDGHDQGDETKEEESNEHVRPWYEAVRQVVDKMDAWQPELFVSGAADGIDQLQEQLQSRLLQIGALWELEDLLGQLCRALEAASRRTPKTRRTALQQKWMWIVRQLQQQIGEDGTRQWTDADAACNAVRAFEREVRIHFSSEVDTASSSEGSTPRGPPHIRLWSWLVSAFQFQRQAMPPGESMHTRVSGSTTDSSSQDVPAVRPSEKEDSSSDMTNVPVPQLLRSIGTYLGYRSPAEDSFLCLICYDRVPMASGYCLEICRHQFCTQCIKSYVDFTIGQGEVCVQCFHPSATDGTIVPCSTKLTRDDIERLASATTWRKYVKFQFNKNNKHARQCPYCDHSQVCAGPDAPDCKCEVCGRSFCYLHSSAHIGGSCAAYERDARATDTLNIAAINKACKECPGCGHYVEKDGGCNQMKCVVCRTSFCWICQQVVDDSTFPVHFQWWNLRGCAGNQMVDLDQASTVERFMSVAFRCLFFVVIGPPAFALAIITSLLGCCCYPCTKLFDVSYRQAFTTWLCISGYLLLSPLILVAAILLAPFVSPVPDQPTGAGETTLTSSDAKESHE